MGYFSVDGAREREIVPGGRQRVLGWGGRMMMVRYTFAAGTVLPMHAHPHEQTGLVLCGAGEFTLGDEKRKVRAGDGWTIPGDVPHGVRFTEDSIVIEVFCPPREDFMK
jgi:quercetin dioxygenase-like cupin family protein